MVLKRGSNKLRGERTRVIAEAQRCRVRVRWTTSWVTAEKSLATSPYRETGGPTAGERRNRAREGSGREPCNRNLTEGPREQHRVVSIVIDSASGAKDGTKTRRRE